MFLFSRATFFFSGTSSAKIGICGQFYLFRNTSEVETFPFFCAADLFVCRRGTRRNRNLPKREDSATHEITEVPSVGISPRRLSDAVTPSAIYQYQLNSQKPSPSAKKNLTMTGFVTEFHMAEECAG